MSFEESSGHPGSSVGVSTCPRVSKWFILLKISSNDRLSLYLAISLHRGLFLDTLSSLFDIIRGVAAGDYRIVR